MHSCTTIRLFFYKRTFTARTQNPGCGELRVLHPPTAQVSGSHLWSPTSRSSSHVCPLSADNCTTVPGWHLKPRFSFPIFFLHCLLNPL